MTIFILRAPAIYGAAGPFWPPCSLATVYEETGVREEVIGVLLKVMSIICTRVHNVTSVVVRWWCCVNRFPESARNRLLLYLFLRGVIGSCVHCCDHVCLVWRGWSLLVGRQYSIQIYRIISLTRILLLPLIRKKATSREVEAVVKVFSDRVLVTAELWDVKEVVCHWVLFCDVGTIAYLTTVIMVKELLVVIGLRAAFISFLR